MMILPRSNHLAQIERNLTGTSPKKGQVGSSCCCQFLLHEMPGVEIHTLRSTRCASAILELLMVSLRGSPTIDIFPESIPPVCLRETIPSTPSQQTKEIPLKHIKTPYFSWCHHKLRWRMTRCKMAFLARISWRDDQSISPQSDRTCWDQFFTQKNNCLVVSTNPSEKYMSQLG